MALASHRDRDEPLLCFYSLFLVFDQTFLHTVLDVSTIRVSTAKVFLMVRKSIDFFTIFSL